MVLRGSKTHPDSADIMDIQHAIHNLQHYLTSLETQEHDIEHEITNIILHRDDMPTIDNNEQQTIIQPSTQTPHQQMSEITQLNNYKQLQIPTNLNTSIKILIDRLQYLEHKHDETVVEISEKQGEFKVVVQQFVSGGLAGMTARTTVAPIDRVKLLIQTAIALRRTEAGQRGIWETAKHEINKGGIRSMWKGNFTNCIRVFPYAALQFSSYERYKHYILDYCESIDRDFGFVERLASGACAGATAATLTYPLDVMRVRQVVYDDIKGPVDAIKNIYGEGGIRCFYKGWTPTLLSLAPFIACNFATFDWLKSVCIEDGDTKNASTALVLGLGACAGLAAQTVCYPLDTVRRSMQMPKHDYNNIADCFYKIYSGNGIRSFYKGLLPNAIKIVPNNGIRFLMYSKLTEYLNIPQTKIRPKRKRD